MTTSIASRIAALPDFPFRQLAALLDPIEPAAGKTVLDFSLGEPQHQPPKLLQETINQNSHLWNRYPPPSGTIEFKTTAAEWLERRFNLTPGSVDPVRNLLPLAGTKEGLFLLPSLAQSDGESKGSGAREKSIILMPNPLYSVYLGGSTLAGFRPQLLSATPQNGFMPDLSELDPEMLDRTAMCFLCNPSNPQGAIASRDQLEQAVRLARKHNFILIIDECYSEIYDREPPFGGLAAAQGLNGSFDHVVVLHSLSKRSNAAGLRSGFIAGDAGLLARFLKLRAYGAAVQPLPLMAAATALWLDEEHVVTNRDAYRRKIDLASNRLGNRFGFKRPGGGFFLWLDVGDGVDAATKLWQQAALKVLPGRFLTAPVAAGEPDPGSRYIRLALVHDEAMVADALDRLSDVLN